MEGFRTGVLQTVMQWNRENFMEGTGVRDLMRGKGVRRGNGTKKSTINGDKRYNYYINK